jgi:hypothetical protein
MNTYSDTNPPKHGNGKKIYAALKRAGFGVLDLHYNPNLWGRAPEDGWGTWACTLSKSYVFECFCGIKDNSVYIQGHTAPYETLFLEVENV